MYTSKLYTLTLNWALDTRSISDTDLSHLNCQVTVLMGYVRTYYITDLKPDPDRLFTYSEVSITVETPDNGGTTLNIEAICEFDNTPEGDSRRTGAYVAIDDVTVVEKCAGG